MTTETIELSGDYVHKLFLECLPDTPDGVVLTEAIEGIMVTVCFNADKIKEKKGEIIALLDDLPDEFKASGGGGWTFLNMCMDRRGGQWTGLHSTQEELMLLGMAIKRVSYTVGRDMWPILPGGLPYIIINDKG